MKNKIAIKIIFTFAFFFFIVFDVQAEKIDSFNQEMIISPDGSLLVEETIVYDFGSLNKHGIYRDIPYIYNNKGFSYKIKIDNKEVFDENNSPYNFSISRANGDIRIKIGNSSGTITGVHTYIIKYRVKKAISFFDNFDEVYWNVTGNNWPVAIKSLKSTLVLPGSVSQNKLGASCYVGEIGSKNNCDNTEYNKDKYGKVKSVTFKNKSLYIHEGLTVALSFPLGLIDRPSKFRAILNFILDNYILGLPFIVFLILYYIWNEKGKDPLGKKTIIARYSPPSDLSPMSLGTLIDERVDNKDFSSNIISLAVKGYLRIVKVDFEKIFKKDEYALIGLQGTKKLSKNERTTLEKLFSFAGKSSTKNLEKLKKTEHIEDKKNVLFLSDLKNKFYEDLDEIKNDVHKELTEKGYFATNPNTIRGVYVTIGTLGLFASFFLIDFFGLLYGISSFLSFVLVLFFSRFMPKKTKKGVETMNHALGLKLYLEVAEKDRFDFHYAPEKNPKLFEKLLPYAIALGVEKKWAKQFENYLSDYNPSWYGTTAVDSFSFHDFSGNLSAFNSSANSFSSSKPSSAGSGGSGFSGGGFGGGGGGSW